MHKSMTFNNIRKPWLYLLEGREKSPFAPVRNNLIRVMGMPGAHVVSKETDVLYINQPVGFIASSDEEALQRQDELADWLVTNTAVPLEFDDEPGRIYYAEIEGTIEDFRKIARKQYRGNLTFLIADGYGYAEEKTISFDDSIIIENKGTAETDPIIELTATEKSTFAMISNGEEYNLIGQPAEVDETVVDSKDLILSERGDSLGDWSESGTEFDSGFVTGELGTDGTGILPLNYGSPGSHEGWYGPALMKEINPIQDFEVEMRLRADTTSPDQMYRIEFYLYDENMQVLGKMAIRDYALKNIRYAAEARYGEYITGRPNYLISKDNYLKERGHFHGMIRMKREGNKFEFYVARLKTGEDEGRHHDTFKATYRDLANEYQGKLKYVQINIARHTEGPPGNIPRINAINVYELSEATADETPYIIYPGDVVTFDHKDEDILINGEARNDLKNFGASYFKLHKGDNTIVVSPEDSFDSEIKYRERYR